MVVKSVEHLAQLWAGMGNVYAIKAQVTSSGDDGEIKDIVCKHVCYPTGKHISHGDRRKVLSYGVEAKFYSSMSERCIKAGC